MTDDELARRKRELIAEESKKPHGWWYLSFADDTGVLGAAIVLGQGPVTAIDRAFRLGLNPGDCEIACLSLDADNVARTPAKARERFLSKEDLVRLLGPIELVKPPKGDRRP
jgi:hypothetical protein